ncbi:MAG: AAA family ATPase [Planctomycetes bacterium]|nr:AAA family ATPase [Planctomycetota bacterium]
MIYTDYWDLEYPPFGEERAETFVPTKSSTLAIARLRYALGREMGASALFGESGLGKSLLARMLVDEFSKAGWQAVYLPGPRGGARDILARFDANAARACERGADPAAELQQYWTERAALGRLALLAVDDAHTSRTPDFLEMLRTLLNIRSGGRPVLSILLVGQQSLERRLADASGFGSQLAIRAVLEPMTADESRLYILAKLKAAGSSQGIFTRHAADRVVELCNGVPRQINRLCELALVIAYGLESQRISPDIIDMAAADLDMLPGDEAAFYPWPHPEPEPEAEPEEEQEPEEDILASLPAEG